MLAFYRFIHLILFCNSLFNEGNDLIVNIPAIIYKHEAALILQPIKKYSQDTHLSLSKRLELGFKSILPLACSSVLSLYILKS